MPVIHWFQVTASFVEDGADISHGTLIVIGKAFNKNSNAMGSITLEGNFLKVCAFVGSLVDSADDDCLWAYWLLLHSEQQVAGAGCFRDGATFFDGYLNFLNDARKDLASFGIECAFLAFDG